MQERYRGYSSKDKNWYYGDLVDKNIIVSFFETGELLPNEALTQCKCDCHKVDKESIGRFIEKYDNTNQPIYEGDILECFFNEYDSINRLRLANLCGYINGVVEYIPNRALFELRFNLNKFNILGCEFGHGGEKFTIIGNIFNNPELLNK